jgi:hypothetical protein
MRYGLIALWLLACSATTAVAQLSINFGSPGVSIGINLPVYPTLQRVPGYPVYYAPGVDSNYFFYDGLYWVYDGDNWYASSWYNGPWRIIDRFDVPVFLLRVPVRYYHRPPAYFRGWRASDAPRWGEHWGNSWEQRRSGWDRWDRKAAPAPAPLPTYQRQYSGTRYPQQTQQVTIQTQNYRYQPRDTVAREYVQQQRTHVQAAPQQQAAPQPPPRQQAQPQVRQQAQPAPQQPQQPQQQQQQAERQKQQQQQQQQQQGERQKQQAERQKQQAERAKPQPQQPQSQPPERARPQPQPQQQPQAAPREQQQPRSQGQDKGQSKGRDKDKEDKDDKDNKDKGKGR